MHPGGLQKRLLGSLPKPGFGTFCPKVICLRHRALSLLFLFALAVRDAIVTESFSDVSQTIGHVLCPQKETCTYPFCQKVQENKELWPLFMDETVSERIIKQLAGKSKEGFVSYLMQHSDLTFEQAESIFYFQIHGCLTINRLMLQNNCRDWHNVQQTIDRFIRAGLQEFLQDGE